MAMLILIDAMVMATIRHNESEPIASVAATASVNRDDAIGVQRRVKPAGPVSGVMAGHPHGCERESLAPLNMSRDSRAILGQCRLERGEKAATAG